MENLVYRTAENEDIDNLVKLRLEYVKADYGEIDAETETTLRTQLNEYFPAHLGKDIFGFFCFDGEKAVNFVRFVVCERFVQIPFGE